MAKWRVTYQTGGFLVGHKIHRTEIEADRRVFGEGADGTVGTFFLRGGEIVAFFKKGTIHHYELLPETEAESVENLRAMWGDKP